MPRAIPSVPDSHGQDHEDVRPARRNLLDGPESRKRRATQIKRVAGGLTMNYVQAEKIAKDRISARDTSEKRVRAEMASIFGTLSSIKDRVALIAAVQSYQRREGRVISLTDLDCHAMACCRRCLIDVGAGIL